MGLRVQCVCIDSADPDRLAAFWAAALGWRRTHEEPDQVVLEPPESSREEGLVPDLLFLRVPEPKAGKNRLHLDLRPTGGEGGVGGVGGEVDRLIALGARRAQVGQVDADVSWVVMADPEDNEFCVLRADPGPGD